MVVMSTHDFVAFSFIDIGNSKHGANQVVLVIRISVGVSVAI